MMIMDKYIYLLLSLFLLSVWLVFFFLSKNKLRKILIKISILGGLAGLIAEFWYFRDYWHPLSVIGSAKYSPEDFLAGFAVTGIGLTLGVFFRNKNKKDKKGHKIIFFILIAISIFILLLFSNLLKVNSVLISILIFFALSLVMALIRKDLGYQSVISGTSFLLLVIPIYILLFDFLSPSYWNKYWLLANTVFGIKVLGNIPITEMLWYFSWGCFAGIAYDFYYGNKNKTLR